VPTLGSAYPDDRFTILAGSPAIAIYPPPRFENADGRMVILANQVRLAVPAGSGRLEPYFVAGGGVASVRRTADYVWIYPYYCPACLATAEGLPSEIARGLLAPSPGAFTERIASSSVELALTIGGGLSVRVTSELSVDADLRAFRLLGEQDRTVGRFGVGVRYRF
jgi:opacity protein-like surface antigen